MHSSNQITDDSHSLRQKRKGKKSLWVYPYVQPLNSQKQLNVTSPYNNHTMYSRLEMRILQVIR